MSARSSGVARDLEQTAPGAGAPPAPRRGRALRVQRAGVPEEPGAGAAADNANAAPGATLYPTAAMLSNLTLASMAVFTVAVIAPAAAADIGVAPTAIGLYVSAVYGFGGLSGLVTGSLVTRFGAIRTCQLTMGLVAASLWLLILSAPLAAAASAVLLGLAYGMLNPASARVLSAAASTRLQPLVFSIKQSGVPLGGVLAGLLVPTLVLTLGWKIAVLAVGAAALAVAAVCQPLRRGFDDGRIPGAPVRFKALGEPIRLVWKRRDLKVLSVISVAYAGCQISLGSFFVLFLIAHGEMSLLDAGIAFTALQVGGFVGRLAWGSVAGRLWSGWSVLAVIGFFMAAGLLLLMAASSGWPLWAHSALGFVLGATCYGWNGVFFAEVARRAPGGRCEEATGAVQSIMFAGIMVFPPLFAVLIAIFEGYAGAFLGLALAVAVAAVLALRTPAAHRAALAGSAD